MTKMILPNELVLEEAGKLLEEGREVVITPLGDSMLPFIRGGKDEVTLKAMPHVDVGDIVLARLPGPAYVLHRVVDRNRSLLVLMGDGNVRGMESCTRDDVMGTVTSINGIPPGDGMIWRYLRPFRRILLAIYKRLK
ncbi:MAG: S24/S26 family peptidase [Bacteroidales bacterium]|nr:S24/S26 family peptidase [Bacteroidales bacterium]